MLLQLPMLPSLLHMHMLIVTVRIVRYLCGGVPGTVFAVFPFRQQRPATPHACTRPVSPDCSVVCPAIPKYVILVMLSLSSGYYVEWKFTSIWIFTHPRLVFLPKSTISVALSIGQLQDVGLCFACLCTRLLYAIIRFIRFILIVFRCVFTNDICAGAVTHQRLKHNIRSCMNHLPQPSAKQGANVSKVTLLRTRFSVVTSY